MKLLLPVIAAITLSSGIFRENAPIYFYTGSNGKSGSSPISLCALDAQTGQIKLVYTFNELVAPGYICFSPNKKYLYSVSSDQKINALSVDRNRRLSLINAQSSEGVNPCHVSVTPQGDFAFIANYTGGSIAAYPLAKDGSVLPLAYREQYTGSGPNLQRQKESHAHCTAPSKDGKFFYAADLGADKVMNYTVNPTTGTVSPNPVQPFIKVHGGAGPRHLVATQKNLYLINEMDATLCAFSMGRNGALKLIATYPTIPADFSGSNSSAAIRLHPNGKFLYVSNRGYNSIHGFIILANGTLQSVGEVRQAIDAPRDFNIDPSGKFMIIGNQGTNDLTVYTVDVSTGKMAFKNKSISLNAPSCIEFF